MLFFMACCYCCDLVAVGSRADQPMIKQRGGVYTVGLCRPQLKVNSTAFVLCTNVLCEMEVENSVVAIMQSR